MLNRMPKKSSKTINTPAPKAKPSDVLEPRNPEEMELEEKEKTDEGVALSDDAVEETTEDEFSPDMDMDEEESW